MSGPGRAPIGLLTLQGDDAKHRQALEALGRTARGVRRPAELAGLGGLIIPGGESTTLTRLVDRAGLRGPLCDFAAARPILGTCAGLIMLARETTDEVRSDFGVAPLGLLDCAVLRNGYGRQIDSFTAPIGIDVLDGSREPFPAVFIRAPRITAVGAGVDVVARHEGEPVAVRQGHLLGLTFHPELTDDLRFHRAFLALVDEGG